MPLKEVCQQSDKVAVALPRGPWWEARPSKIKNSGTWCPTCSGTMRLTLKEMHALAKEHGGECLSRKYVNTDTKLRWRCAEGHDWKAVPSSVKLGTWCPTCNGNVRLTLKEMHALANGRGGKCLSTTYVNALTKLRWRCAEGHEWEAVPSSVKQGHWCRECAGNRPNTIEQMQALAKEHHGKCLSSKYVNAHTKLRWRCVEGHEWEAKPMNMKARVNWCTKCPRVAQRRAPA